MKRVTAGPPQGRPRSTMGTGGDLPLPLLDRIGDRSRARHLAGQGNQKRRVLVAGVDRVAASQLRVGDTGDFYPVHIDAQYAATQPVGERIAHDALWSG